MLDGSPYQGYLYAYPHKTAYRPLRPRPSLREVWADEPRHALFLYLHVPFCEMRCGFCNLFTRANPPAEQVGAYLRQLRHQAAATADALGGAGFARAAIGGGTPTFLTADELAELLTIPAGLGVDLPRAALSVETSPATATADRIAVLAGHGVHRVSMGVQSFLDAEAHAAGRPQRRAEVEAALDVLFAAAIPVRNLDLIYGIPGQSAATWQFSLDETLRRRPEEVYLYPLYVRPLTGLARRHDTGPDPAWDRQRLDLYRQGRDALRAAGYRQLSMRQFRRSDVLDPDGPDYCCQDDGMVGLGCGSRSYTRELHYSFDYAVGVGGVRAIIDDYLRRPPGDFAFVEHGFRLDAVEQRRRWVLKSLLRADGLDLAAYTARFGTEAGDDFPALPELAGRGWLDGRAGALRLTDDGLAHSDAIGPWLVSGPVRELMAGHAPR
ncbi:STM4012 family radical SAM protein [Catellatospora sp. NEAU-YM18]|nr:STM4012 family radical SAM protein [Catellatospora tritici]